MSKRDGLTLHEEILLIALKTEKGTTPIEGHLDRALGGAILADLVLGGRIRLQKEKKKQFAIVDGAGTTGNELLDECLGRVAESKKRQQLKTWVQRFSKTKNLKRRVALQLCRKGILRGSEDRVLLIFKRAVYPAVDSKPERELVERMRKAIFTDESWFEPRTKTLVALAFHTDLLKNVFTKKELKSCKKRVESLTSDDSVGEATKEAVKAAQVAHVAIFGY